MTELIAMGRNADLRAGIRAMAPVTLAYVPFGLAVGAAVGASANPTAAWLSTWTIYGGAAHLAVLQVLADGSGWVAAAALGLLVNLRLTAYAAAMAPLWREVPVRGRAVGALLLTDAPWALMGSRGSHPAARQRWFYVGAAVTLWFVWPALVTTGVLLGNLLTAYAVLHLLPALTLGTVVMQRLRDRAGASAGVAAGVTALLTSGLQASWALALCAAVGVAAGLFSEKLR